MSDLSLLSSRAITGMYYAALEAATGANWLAGVANDFGSDQASETYNFLGQTPMMREWIGRRQAKSFNGNGVTIINKHYEATLEIAKKDARRDKTGQIRARIGEFALRGQSHWASLVSTLILNGATTTCYDGQFFFDTDHTEGENSTNQSNSITVTLSTLPIAGASHGTSSAPTVEEMQQAILRAIVQIVGFKDDRNEPMNEGANRFLVMVPASLYPVAVAAVSTLMTAAMLQNLNPNMIEGLTVDVAMNTRLSTWTTKFAVFRTDSPMKALIRQTEQDIEMKVKAEGSDFEFDHDAWQWGLDGWRGVGYGYWQRACLVTMA
jgi:phage major head subunit gpT-like protein